tara:strand:- start:48 stop:1376 length:1329 start_codon:yes stop_codon:yes gene_type:complete
MASQQTPEETRYPSLLAGSFTLGVLVLAFIVSFVDRQVLALLVNPIQADLGVGDFEMSLLVGFAFALFYCVLGIPLGKVADRTNRKRLIAFGIVLWSFATILCGFANSFVALFFFRMLVGVGEATLAPAGYSLLADTFPPHRLVRATAIFSLGGMLGAGVAMLVGGQVIDYATTAEQAPFGLDAFEPWQATFIIVGAPGFVVAGLILLAREPVRKGTAKATEVSAKTLAYLWERRRDYAPIYAAATGMAVVSYGGLTWFPTHVIRTFGITAGEAGLILGSIQIVGAILGTLLGVMLTEKLIRMGHPDGHLRSVMITALFAAATLIAPLMGSLELTAAVWFLSTIFQNAYYGSLTAALQIITPNQSRGTNSAVFVLVITMFGLAVGSALIGGLAQFAFSDEPRGVGYGIAIVGTAAALFASASAWWGMKHYRQIVSAHLPPVG